MFLAVCTLFVICVLASLEFFMKGLLISFDGIDSSGKATQAKDLSSRLASRGFTVKQLATPDYTTATGKKLKAYFQGTAGAWDDLSWQEQMTLLAANRAEHRQEVVDSLSHGGIVIYDRYVPSSLAHMTVDALSVDETASQREKIMQAVRRHEYDTNRMPKEDASIFLDVPPAVAARLLTSRQATLEEKAEATDSLALQARIYQEYQYLISTDPDHYIKIDCAHKDQLLPIHTISDKVWHEVTSRFPQFNDRKEIHDF